MNCPLCLQLMKVSYSSDGALYDCNHCIDNFGNTYAWVVRDYKDKILRFWISLGEYDIQVDNSATRNFKGTRIWRKNKGIILETAPVKVDLTREALQEKVKMLLTFS